MIVQPSGPGTPRCVVSVAPTHRRLNCVPGCSCVSVLGSVGQRVCYTRKGRVAGSWNLVGETIIGKR